MLDLALFRYSFDSVDLIDPLISCHSGVAEPHICHVFHFYSESWNIITKNTNNLRFSRCYRSKLLKSFWKNIIQAMLLAPPGMMSLALSRSGTPCLKVILLSKFSFYIFCDSGWPFKHLAASPPDVLVLCPLINDTK